MNNWKDWEPGKHEIPVDRDTLVTVVRRDGVIWTDKAGLLNWGKMPKRESFEIVQYRVESRK